MRSSLNDPSLLRSLEDKDWPESRGSRSKSNPERWMVVRLRCLWHECWQAWSKTNEKHQSRWLYRNTVERKSPIQRLLFPFIFSIQSVHKSSLRRIIAGFCLPLLMDIKVGSLMLATAVIKQNWDRTETAYAKKVHQEEERRAIWFSSAWKRKQRHHSTANPACGRLSQSVIFAYPRSRSTQVLFFFSASQPPLRGVRVASSKCASTKARQLGGSSGKRREWLHACMHQRRKKECTQQ